MKKYFIKRMIIAKSLQQALRDERKAEITEIWQDYSYIHQHQNKRTTGFTDKKK
jgi:hypothetical protein